MDLSFSRFGVKGEAAPVPPEFAVLLVGIAARQATSTTALLHQALANPSPDSALLKPVDGAFNGATAASIASWKQE